MSRLLARSEKLLTSVNSSPVLFTLLVFNVAPFEERDPKEQEMLTKTAWAT